MFLAIDTSNNILSLCVFDSQRTIKYIESTTLSSEDIATLVQQVVKEEKISTKDIKAIFTSLGPGSFTGIKSCVSFAKVLSYAINCPVYGFNSLDILASDYLLKQKNTPNNNIIASINAYNKQTYVQAFDSSNINKLSNIETIKTEELDNFARKYNNAKIVGYKEGEESKYYANALAISKLASINQANIEAFKDLTPYYIKNPYKKS